MSIRYTKSGIPYTAKPTSARMTAAQRSYAGMVARTQRVPRPMNRGVVSRLNRRAVASKETGFVELAAATYAMNTTGSVTLIATIPQGASVNQRVGKKVLLKSLQIRGQCVPGGTTTLASHCAWMIVYDRRPTGALPAVTDILVSAAASSFTNDANSGRFKILRRWQNVIIGNITTAGQSTDSSVFVVDEYLKLKGLPVVFKAAGTGAIGDIEEGALYLVTVGDTVAGAADGDAILGFRTRFIDN